MKNFTARQKTGMRLFLDCKAENIDEAKKYFAEKSSIECDVWEDVDQSQWVSTNGYEGEFKTFEEMEELEFKHVAHRYLPYGLQYMYKGKRQELINLHYFYSYGENGEIAGKSLCTRVSDPDLNDIQCLITAVIPVLRPISDIEKGMEIEKLLEGHFDVFNLIGTNRAVSY